VTTIDPAAGTDDDLALLGLARELAERAGLLVQERRAEAVLTGTTKSSATDLVTEADRAAEQAIIAGILAVRPTDAILGEESVARSGTSGVRWIVDPIDGTTNYVYGLPAYAVSIAVERDGEIVVGVVHDPVGRITYTARRGHGASCDGRPLSCSDRSELATALVATGFSYASDQRAQQAAVLVEVLPRIRDIRRFGAASLDLCAVAAGRVDAYYEQGLQPWDLAAGWLIAREAGARVGDLRGGPPSGQYVVAAAPALFRPLVSLLVDAGADGGPRSAARPGG
jgi:myo-inositol-1(or 4)-monophosphatase